MEGEVEKTVLEFKPPFSSEMNASPCPRRIGLRHRSRKPHECWKLACVLGGFCSPGGKVGLAEHYARVHPVCGELLILAEREDEVQTC